MVRAVRLKEGGHMEIIEVILKKLLGW